MVETQGLTHINLLVADVHRAKTFYERVFGLQELFWDGPVFMRPPGTHDTITLRQSPDVSRGPGNIDHFGFRLADRGQLDRATEEVIAAGGALLGCGEHRPGSPYATSPTLTGT